VTLLPVKQPCGSVVNISGYRFVKLDLLPLLQADMQAALLQTGVLGTILLAEEGINIALAGSREQIDLSIAYFQSDDRFKDIWLKESHSDTTPFAKLKVRVRHEIIAFDGAHAADKQLHRRHAPAVSPETVAQWLDEERNVTLLDTRNTYEIASGTFTQAEHLDIAHFRDFQKAVKSALDDGRMQLDQPMVTFCTGGIRCEKAAPWMLEQGFKEVYQIDGGVLNYFQRTGGKHWDGDCFVFDDRVELDKTLAPTGATWCTDCQLTISPGQVCTCQAQSSSTAIDTV